jgi:hypothetical protein
MEVELPASRGALQPVHGQPGRFRSPTPADMVPRDMAMSLRRLGWIPSLFLVVLTGSPPAAWPVERCKVRVDRSSGDFQINAREVSGTLRWGATLGQESTAVANAACVDAKGIARRCLLGPSGSPTATTAPPGCVVFLADDGTQRCAVEVKGCLPTPPPLPCTLFPADNIWNADISALPVHPLSDTYVASIGADTILHPDFGSGLYSGGIIGIPYTVVPAIQPLVPLSFLYADESDPGPYPVPPLAPVEGGRRLGRGRGDAHVLIVEESSCTLYEIYASKRIRGGTEWKAGSGAVWDLGSNALRPDTWTSADAAGLPILPGLVRFDEVEAGAINHALRFTVPRTQRAYLWPARHFASSSTDPSLPPMGLRFRLKAGVDISGFSPHNQVILTALKQYGMILADNGSAWYVSGTSDPRWDNDELRELRSLRGSDFEAVDASSLMVDPDSGEVP